MVRVVNTCKKIAFCGSSLETLHTSIAPEWFRCVTWSIFRVGLCLAMARLLEGAQLWSRVKVWLQHSQWWTKIHTQGCMNKEVIWEADNDERTRVIFSFSWQGLAVARLLKDPKWGIHFITQWLNHHSSAFVSAKRHIQRLFGMPRTMVASICRYVLSVIGFGDGTSPEWRPAGPVGLIIFFAKFEEKKMFS